MSPCPRGASPIALRIWLSSAGVAATEVARMLRENPDATDVLVYGTNVSFYTLPRSLPAT